MPCEFAPMTLDPAAVVVARPAALGAFAMVATDATDELQCALAVMSCVVPSLKEPVALNCSVLPEVTVGFAGVMVIDTKDPFPTVKVVVPVTPDALAEIVAVPVCFANAVPAPRTDATFDDEDFQVTPARFVAVLPSLNVPVAVNFNVVR